MPLELTAAGPATRDPEAVRAAAADIVARGLWCAIEICLDVPAQRWEQVLVVCRTDAEVAAAAVAAWTRAEPDRDARLTGCRRSDLRPHPGAPVQLVHLAALGATDSA